MDETGRSKAAGVADEYTGVPEAPAQSYEKDAIEFHSERESESKSEKKMEKDNERDKGERFTLEIGPRPELVTRPKPGLKLKL
ncbi:hypothetical protein EVAR_93745_1 [Eumeta japonica]|uniref:Uncharacterized protein n=1 Tax=Eumeta variegata TaxID=151549 RepID=A0A4C1U2T6_EUMVA|nr:hypothetical protein EVAR_93745_1 [Eumeta japonica]